MNKRGQFYLIAAMIIVALILGFAAITNEIKKEEFTELESATEELKIEGQAVLDHAAYQKLTDTEINDLLISFTQSYSNYTSAENLYFIFGDSSEITVAAYRRSSPGEILVNGLEFVIEQETYTYNSYASPPTPTIITINEIDHEFELKQGENFYFILSQGREGGAYFFTGGVVKDFENDI